MVTAAEERSADIVQLRVRHGRHRLIMRLETRDLTRRGSAYLGPTFIIRAGTRRYNASTSAAAGDDRYRRLVFLQRLSGRDVPCRGLFTDFDFTGDVAMISVPRRCLGDPRSVRIKAIMSRTPGPDEIRLDSALDGRRYLPVTATPRIVSGPRPT